MNPKKYLAEFIGTFTLTLMVSISIISPLPISTPLVAGLTLGLFVYTIGNVSGAHLNPAVTISMATVKKVSNKDAVLYIVAQILGALLAMSVVQWMTGSSANQLATNTNAVGIAEAFGAFILVFGVSAAMHDKIGEGATGLVVGGSLFLGILAAMRFSNGVLNPAVAIGIGSISAMYLLAPIVGGLAAAWVFRYLHMK